MKTAVISEKGQVTIPKPLRKRMGLTAGTVLRFEEEDGRLVASRVVPIDPVRVLFGLGDIQGLSTDEYLEQSRGPAWSADLDPE